VDSVSDAKRAFRDRLIEHEPVTPALRERYEKEVQAMFQKQLTRAQRVSWAVMTVASVVLGVLFAVAAVAAPSEFPVYGRISFAAGVLFAIGFAVVGFRVSRRGAMDLKTEGAAYSGLAWGLPVVLLTLYMVYAPNDLVGLRMIVCGVVFLIMGAVFLLRQVVEQSELKTREKLLEIEYRLAELQELVKPRS
jgi:hypothetical protein